MLAWRYGGEDPWRLYNALDADYRPLEHPERPPMRPRYPTRLRSFMYACAEMAAIMDNRMSDTIGNRGKAG